MRWYKLVAVILTMTWIASVNPQRAAGQAMNATLLGTVTDKSGAVVGGAKIAITEIKTGVGRTSVTNDSGNYEFPNIRPGVYQVVVEQPGFKKQSRPEVEVTVNSTVRVDLQLEPGATTEVVVVTGEIPILQTDRADVGAKIDNRQVVDLPLGNNRNFQNLLNLVPGTTRAHRVHSEFFNSQDSLATEVNGQSRLFNNLQIEGVDDNERTGLLQVYIPPAEAVQTVDVSTSNYAAEFGRAGGAVTNVVLKSGTNNFHGAAYEFNRVSALAARSFFNSAPGFFPRTTYNYYGGNLGGPIFKNKLFFFGDILRIDDSRGKFDRLTLPTDAFRGGDLRPGGVNIYDPSTGNPVTGAGRTQFSASSNPGDPTYNPACTSGTCLNVIPLNRISPLAQKILALVPHTNLPGLSSNYQATSRFLKNTTSFDTKFDFNRTDNDRFAFRFSRAVQDIDEEPIFGLAGGPKGGGFQGTGVQHVQSGALNHTHVFSPTLIVETRFGVSHYRNIARSSDYGTNASDALGITGVNLDPFTSGLTAMDIQGGFSSPMIGYSASLPWDRGETNINGVSNWTKIRGNHTLKWGADIRRLRDDLVQAQTFGPRGVFRFGTGTTSIPGSGTGRGNNFAAFLIDAPTEVGRDISVISGSWRETELFFYGQDKWQMTSKLTLDAGLRWELYLPPTPRHAGGYSNYDPTNNTLVIAGVGGNPENLGRETYHHYFAPRIGAAYRLTEKLVFRGGFGISFEPFPNNQYAWNFPVRQANGTNQASSLAQPKWPSGQVATMALGFPTPAPVAVPTNGIISTPCPPPPAVPTGGCVGPNAPYNVVDKKFQQPYVESWNLAVQRALPKNFTLEVAYVGNHGVGIPMTYDLNAAVAPSVGATCPQRPLCALFGRTANADFLFKRTSSNYNALQTRFDHRTSSGLVLTTAYTYQRGLAYRSDVGDGGGNDGGTPSFYLDFRRNYMVVSNNRKHTFVQSFVYELPFGKGKPLLNSGWANWVAGGWQVSGVLSILSGRPLDFNASGTSLNAPGTRQTPNQTGSFRILGGVGTTALWFDTSAFTPVTTPQTPGNMSRFTFAGPRYFNLDAALFKRFTLTERIGLELRGEAFSATNTPQFDQPNANASDNVNFGRITNTIGGNRSVELGAKLTF